MTNLTAADLAAMKARADAATPGNWEHCSAGQEMVDGYHYVTESEAGNIAEDLYFADAEFIAHAREDVPALLAALKALEKRVAAQDRLLMENDEDVAMAYWEDSQKAEAEVAALRRQIDLADRAPHSIGCPAGSPRAYEWQSTACICWKAEYDAAKEER